MHNLRAIKTSCTILKLILMEKQNHLMILCKCKQCIHFLFYVQIGDIYIIYCEESLYLFGFLFHISEVLMQ